ncbi:hypothetical protein BGX29_003857 [Mortierella sp. GBA35]|nr:hypothetical protein BGX29_003857 [Mortierella sp. GBA35]
MSTLKPTVLIVGAGLGGLMLGALLEKASIPYTIFERATTVKPIGSAHLIGPSVMPLFAQLGIEEEFIRLGQRATNSVVIKEDEGPVLTVDYQAQGEYSGYYSYIVSRPTLYNLLLKLVPSHKILFGKRVVNISEDNDKVTIQTADDSTYVGDILVGADGAYSTVRQRMYQVLKAEGKLPKSDQDELPYYSTCLIGQTKVLDLADFPNLQGSTLFNTLGKDKPFTWMAFWTAQNTLCWMVIHHLDDASRKAAEAYRSKGSQDSEWEPYAALTMCDETHHFPISIGGKNLTMGDIYDWTPKELISKVMLEEKVFQTWHSGRTVLLGDACHKLNPIGAQGAIIAMHGALALANLLYALPSNTSVEIERIFAAYKEERIGPAVEVFQSSHLFAKFMDKSYVGALLLFIMRRLPAWIVNMATRRMIRYRPLASWLPKVEDKGSIPAESVPSSEKAREAFEKRSNAVFV